MQVKNIHYPTYNNPYEVSYTGIYEHRNRSCNKKISNTDRIKAITGSLIGTVIPMAIMMKKQKIKNPLKLKYGMRDMVGMSAGSIAGGVTLGLVGEDKEVKINRLREGFFQFMNAAIPTWIVGGVLSLCKHSPNHNNIRNKILSTIGGLLVGMYGSAALANVITDPKDKHPDRKLTYKDALANIDDAIGVFVLAKFPFADKLKLERLLPVIYTMCGYRGGKSN